MLKANRTETCKLCGRVMKHVRTIPAAVNLPELYSFKCACGCMRTVGDTAEARTDKEEKAA